MDAVNGSLVWPSTYRLVFDVTKPGQGAVVFGQELLAQPVTAGQGRDLRLLMNLPAGILPAEGSLPGR